MFNSYVKLPEGNGKHMGKKHNNPIFLLRSFWDVGFHSWRGNRLNLLIFSGWNQAMSSMPKILTSQPTHHTWSLAAEIIFGKHSHWPLKYWYTGIYIYGYGSKLDTLKAGWLRKISENDRNLRLLWPVGFREYDLHLTALRICYRTQCYKYKTMNVFLVISPFQS